MKVGLAPLLVLLLAVAGPVAAQQPTPETDPSGVLFWSPADRERVFRRMDSVMPHAVVSRGSGAVRDLPDGAPLALDPAAYMEAERVAGVLVIQDGRVLMERYGLGISRDTPWVSFSMTKSLTSTLVGAALRSGAIRSLEDPVTLYLPELAGGGYDGVTIRQLLTMTSGVAWNEDYADPASDVARFFSEPVVPGQDPVVTYMSRLPRAHAPGTRWNYSTGETNLVGSLLVAAEGRPLAQLLSEHIWSRAGMQADAVWALDQGGREMGGCCVSATLRDWGRVGLMALEGGVLGGERIVPDDWFDRAVVKQADTGEPGEGYGFQWWTQDDGVYGAYGIFGQAIRVDPERRLVIVVLSAWPQAVGFRHRKAREDFFADIVAAVDARSAD
ncbi:MAG TPA: serine hydrolase domain-containing protein [Brevundimonas sp.]|jgi:CubicO group peptidase (beta-lactamase class C family)|uniref:serine hydrolase domain-containing protein n=1 Tax=Brevundimonas sp. TaxID=1871086 RepID=UPI002DE4937E|nr:serine hydrolase domain-containing protein [Brevundimonas sp.]